jgi:predicted kinase
VKKAYMVIGCPGSGKSWVCDQLKNKFDYVHHDAFIGMAGDTYVNEIVRRSEGAKRPLLLEAPFSISKIKEPLERAGFQITPVFIQEDPRTIGERYQKRENKEIPRGHLTRQETYRQRADEWKAFKGTSDQVLEHLKAESNTWDPEHSWASVNEETSAPEAVEASNAG